MKRRHFGRILTASAIGSAVSYKRTAVSKPKKALMHVGCQSGGTTKENLEFKVYIVSSFGGFTSTFTVILL